MPLVKFTVTGKQACANQKTSFTIVDMDIPVLIDDATYELQSDYCEIIQANVPKEDLGKYFRPGISRGEEVRGDKTEPTPTLPEEVEVVIKSTAVADKVPSVLDIVGASIYRRLKKQGIETRADVKAVGIEGLVEIRGIGEAKAVKIMQDLGLSD